MNSSAVPGAGADMLDALAALVDEFDDELDDVEFFWDAPDPEDVATSFSSDAHAATSNKVAAMLKIFMRIIPPLSVGYEVINYKFRATLR